MRQRPKVQEMSPRRGRECFAMEREITTVHFCHKLFNDSVSGHGCRRSRLPLDYDTFIEGLSLSSNAEEN